MKKKHLQEAEKLCMEALGDLKTALRYVKPQEFEEEHYRLHFDAVAKRFEVAFEYLWKYLQMIVHDQGREAYGPKQAIQEAVGLGWIDDPEFWADALDARNGSVHNYFGITEKQYLAIVKRFIDESRNILARIEKS